MKEEAAAGEAAGGAAAPANHLQLKIKSQDNDSIEFRVKPTTKFEKVCVPCFPATMFALLKFETASNS